MRTEIDQRVYGRVSVVQSNSEYLCELVAHWDVEHARDSGGQVPDVPRDYYRSTHHKESLRGDLVVTHDYQHDGVDDGDEDEGNDYSEDLDDGALHLILTYTPVVLLVKLYL